MPARAVPSLSLAAALALALTTAGAAVADGPNEPPAGADPLVTTVETLRNVGGAMWNWLTHQDGLPMTAMEPDVYDWSACPALTHEEARTLLVPEFVAEVPAADGWGHPLELCLWRPGHGRGHVMGVRSPGRDGKFDGTEYVALSFPPAEVDRDLVWMDGYFVTWPEAAP